jgi:lipid-binding SYLF domain-containing protein
MFESTLNPKWLLAASLSLGLALPMQAQVPANQDSNVAQTENEEARRAENATTVLKEIMGIPENGIPEKLMEHAKGVAVIPHVVKGAFVFGGRWGKGLISRRTESGTWSAPAYVEIGGGSWGAQIGVEATDLVLVFTDEKDIKQMLQSNVKIGADASVTVGPVGRKAEVGTDLLLKTGIFAYSRSKGLFAGVSLDGSAIGIDDSADHKVYGNDVTGDQILFTDMQPKTPALRDFTNTLNTISPSSGD